MEIFTQVMTNVVISKSLDLNICRSCRHTSMMPESLLLISIAISVGKANFGGEI